MSLRTLQLSKTLLQQTRAMSSLEYTSERASELRQNIEAVREEIAAAAPSRAPRLVPISKIKPASDIKALYDTANQRHFGENYIQELVDKAQIVRLNTHNQANPVTSRYQVAFRRGATEQ